MEKTTYAGKDYVYWESSSFRKFPKEHLLKNYSYKEEANLCRKKANKMASRLSLKHDIKVSLLLRDKETFEQGQAILPFYQNVASEEIVLYG